MRTFGQGCHTRFTFVHIWAEQHQHRDTNPHTHSCPRRLSGHDIYLTSPFDDPQPNNNHRRCLLYLQFSLHRMLRLLVLRGRVLSGVFVVVLLLARCVRQLFVAEKLLWVYGFSSFFYFADCHCRFHCNAIYCESKL